MINRSVRRLCAPLRAVVAGAAPSTSSLRAKAPPLARGEGKIPSPLCGRGRSPQATWVRGSIILFLLFLSSVGFLWPHPAWASQNSSSPSSTSFPYLPITDCIPRERLPAKLADAVPSVPEKSGITFGGSADIDCKIGKEYCHRFSRKEFESLWGGHIEGQTEDHVFLATPCALESDRTAKVGRENQEAYAEALKQETPETLQFLQRMLGTWCGRSIPKPGYGDAEIRVAFAPKGSIITGHATASWARYPGRPIDSHGVTDPFDIYPLGRASDPQHIFFTAINGYQNPNGWSLDRTTHLLYAAPWSVPLSNSCTGYYLPSETKPIDYSLASMLAMRIASQEPGMRQSGLKELGWYPALREEVSENVCRQLLKNLSRSRYSWAAEVLKGLGLHDTLPKMESLAKEDNQKSQNIQEFMSYVQMDSAMSATSPTTGQDALNDFKAAKAWVHKGDPYESWSKHAHAYCIPFRGSSLEVPTDQMWCYLCQRKDEQMIATYEFYFDPAKDACTLQQFGVRWNSDDLGLLSNIKKEVSRTLGSLQPVKSLDFNTKKTKEDIDQSLNEFGSGFWREIGAWKSANDLAYAFREEDLGKPKQVRFLWRWSPLLERIPSTFEEAMQQDNKKASSENSLSADDKAFLARLRRGWSDDQEGCRNGSDIFRPAIEHGESYLKEHPSTNITPAVILEVARAYESWWSASKAIDDPYITPANYAGEAEAARLKAIDYYRIYLKSDPASFDAKERVYRLEHNIDTAQRAYYCIYD